MEIPIPDYFWHRAKAHIGAFKKGWTAASEGKPCVSPYADKRGGYHNNITFSRSFIVAWEDGWRKYHAAQQCLQPTIESGGEIPAVVERSENESPAVGG